MIYNLRRKFIRISLLSLGAVLAVIFLILLIVNTSQMNKTLDTLTDLLSQNDGAFPELGDAPFAAEAFPSPELITPEARFSTRFFTVWLDRSGEVAAVNTEQISAVSEIEARALAQSAAAKRRERGWSGNYRYKVVENENGKTVIFVDGSMNRNLYRVFLITAALVLIGSGIVVLLMIIVLSGRAVKPVAESYEKQKQFITDANHELKTPLTLILTNLDIADAELGENEWLSDIRAESAQMCELVGRLVTLSRMDEDRAGLDFCDFSLSDAVLDTASEFQRSAEAKGLAMTVTVEPHVSYHGNEAAIRQLVSILLDNALKYCDRGGEVALRLKGRRRPAVIVENTFAAVDKTEFSRLFDRFYRGDKARTAGGGYGIGLSIAKGIAKKHKGDIAAYRSGADRIGFKVVL